MSAITFEIEEEQKRELEKAAIQMNMSLDDLMKELIRAYLSEKQARFTAARSYTRERYTELYKRLA